MYEHFKFFCKLLLAAGLLLMGWDIAQAQPSTQAPAAQPSIDAAALYRQHCAACHGEQRQGLMGPALLPESLARLRQPEARALIAGGRPATQMPGFAAQLDAAQIAALANHIYQPQQPAPQWSEDAIRASRVFDSSSRRWPARPQWTADPMNLFVVVEGGDHHISLVDGERFEVLHRFASRYALHGGPKFSPDGRYVFFGSRDGWISKYDLWNLKLVAEVRAGLNMRNIAVSGDGRWVVAANYLPHTVVVFDADDLQLLGSLPATAADDADGRRSSRVSAVYDAQPRRSFVIAMKDLAEVWELPYPQRAERDGRGPQLAAPRRIALEQPLDDFFFDASYRHLMGAARPQAGSAAPLGQVIDLDAGRKLATLPIAGMPHLGSGISFDWQGRRVMASPNLRDGRISVIALDSWALLAEIATPGPGFFMRSHAQSRYAWVDSMMGGPQARDTLSIIDKQTLTVVASVREPGKTLAHIEFSKDGSHALASLWEMDGALIVYDARSLKEVKRLPMRKPVGKYNVWNKISREEGTSH